MNNAQTDVVKTDEKKDYLIKVDNLKKHFPIKKGIFKRTVGHIKAVDGVSFKIERGRTLGLVGESGCGKSTIGYTMMRILEPTDGNFLYNGDNFFAKTDFAGVKKQREAMQIIFQNPYSSLNPRFSVYDIISEPLKGYNIGTESEREQRVIKVMEQVGLNRKQLKHYPHAFSGGQRQRICIARAIINNPQFIVCDEPVSALDVSVQAQIIMLLKQLQDELGLTFLFISHDLSVVEYVSDYVVVMYLGKIMEYGPVRDLYRNPAHPYTEALLASIPREEEEGKIKRVLSGDVPSPVDLPEGCYFASRCPYAKEECRRSEPELRETGDRSVACHYCEQLNLKGIIGEK